MATEYYEGAIEVGHSMTDARPLAFYYKASRGPNVGERVGFTFPSVFVSVHEDGFRLDTVEPSHFGGISLDEQDGVPRIDRQAEQVPVPGAPRFNLLGEPI